MKRVMIYARTGRDDETAEFHLNDQVASCLAVVREHHDWQVLNIHQEVTGTRPAHEWQGLQHIRERAKHGEFDLLLITDQARLGRKYDQATALINELTRAGVAIYAVANSQ